GSSDVCSSDLAPVSSESAPTTESEESASPARVPAAAPPAVPPAAEAPARVPHRPAPAPAGPAPAPAPAPTPAPEPGITIDLGGRGHIVPQAPIPQKEIEHACRRTP